MRRPLMLDCFCGAGGAATGYHRAGFDVVGVDIRPQPRYPFPFREGDALETMEKLIAGHSLVTRCGMRFALADFAAIHASPPCQAYSAAQYLPKKVRTTHLDLVGPTRDLLSDSRLPYVIENVPGAPLATGSLMLCGSMFGLSVRRHRYFETPFLLLAPGPCYHPREAKYLAGRSKKSGRKNASTVVCVYGKGGSRGHVGQWKEAMGIDWMIQRELSQAIPPAYTDYIGRQLLAQMECLP